MASMVDVRLLEDGEERVFLCLQNRGPMEMTAEIAGMPVGPITLGMYQKVLVGLSARPMP